MAVVCSVAHVLSLLLGLFIFYFFGQCVAPVLSPLCWLLLGSLLAFFLPARVRARLLVCCLLDLDCPRCKWLLAERDRVMSYRFQGPMEGRGMCR